MLHSKQIKSVKLKKYQALISITKCYIFKKRVKQTLLIKFKLDFFCKIWCFLICDFNKAGSDQNAAKQTYRP